MAVLEIVIDRHAHEVSRTEVVRGDPNPRFAKFFQAIYLFNQAQPLHFLIYDVQSDAVNVGAHALIGECWCDLHWLVANLRTEITQTLYLEGDRSCGTLHFTLEQVQDSNSLLIGSVSVTNIPKWSTFSKPNPFFSIGHEISPGNVVLVYSSEVLPKLFSGSFDEFRLPLQFFATAGIRCPIDIIIRDKLKNKPPREFGRIRTTIAEFAQRDATTAPCELPLAGKKASRPTMVSFSGTLEKRWTFLDYLKHGLNLNLITGIDYTSSNGDTRNASSLHHVCAEKPNAYERCITAVGEIVTPYDTDNRFCVFGFGGEYHGRVNHCFPVNFNDSDPYVVGLEGILQAYRESLSKVKLSGPTCFAPLIRLAKETAQKAWDENKTYTILLIITDGCIQDTPATVDAIIESCETSLSILIIGVGNEDFTAMVKLDSDSERLRSTKAGVAKRDIVQFVPFNRFASAPTIALTGAVLEEIPTQVREFCTAHGFEPVATD